MVHSKPYTIMNLAKYSLDNTKVIYFFLAVLLIGGVFSFGKLGKKEQGQAVKYEICSGKNMPERLQKIIEERKKKPGTFAYKNSKYTYLVVCYGEKSYSGYSVRVEQCWKDKEQLYLETQLIGPAAGEEVVETLTYPFLVVRCGRTELLCRIES